MPSYQMPGPTLQMSEDQVEVLRTEQQPDFPALTIQNLCRRVVDAEHMRDFWRAEYERLRAEQRAQYERDMARLTEDAA